MVVSFFFQAEDGIRDSSVTGVQTCALPISKLVPGLYRGAQAKGTACKSRRQPPTVRQHGSRARDTPGPSCLAYDHHGSDELVCGRALLAQTIELAAPNHNPLLCSGPAVRHPGCKLGLVRPIPSPSYHFSTMP